MMRGTKPIVHRRDAKTLRKSRRKEKAFIWQAGLGGLLKT